MVRNISKFSGWWSRPSSIHTYHLFYKAINHTSKKLSNATSSTSPLAVSPNHPPQSPQLLIFTATIFYHTISSTYVILTNVHYYNELPFSPESFFFRHPRSTRLTAISITINSTIQMTSHEHQTVSIHRYPFIVNRPELPSTISQLSTQHHSLGQFLCVSLFFYVCYTIVLYVAIII